MGFNPIFKLSLISINVSLVQDNSLICIDSSLLVSFTVADSISFIKDGCVGDFRLTKEVLLAGTCIEDPLSFMSQHSAIILVYLNTPLRGCEVDGLLNA